MAKTVPDSSYPGYQPGDWVLIDFAAPWREYFQPNAMGRIVERLPGIPNPWFRLAFVFLTDGEYREDHAPWTALRPYSPTEEEITTWHNSRSTTPRAA